MYQYVHVQHNILEILSIIAEKLSVTNVSLMVNVVLLNTVATGSVFQHVNNVVKEQYAREYKDIVLFVNVQRDILEVQQLNVDQNVMVILIVLEIVQHVSMEAVRILVKMLVELMPIVISVG